MLSSELIQEFKIIVQEECGIELNESQSSDLANSLTGYFDLLAKIFHRDRVSVEVPDLVHTNESDQGLWL